MITALGRRVVDSFVSGRRGIAGLVGLALVVGVAFAWALARPPLGPRLSSATADQLGKSGVVLLNPFPWDVAQISKNQAEAVAVSEEAPGTPALDAVLAEVIKTNPKTQSPHLFWVVELPGSAVLSQAPQGSAPGRASYYVAFVDAHTGAFLWAVAEE